MHSSESGSPLIHVHSSAVSQAYSWSLIVRQKDHVIGEFPLQHPGSGGDVGAGGCVVTAGGGVGGLQPSGSLPGIHEHTPADSQSSSSSKSAQNELVDAEYPAQHPSPTGVGAGGVVVVVNTQSFGSSVTSHSQFAAESQARSFALRLLQNISNGASP